MTRNELDTLKQQISGLKTAEADLQTMVAALMQRLSFLEAFLPEEVVAVLEKYR